MKKFNFKKLTLSNLLKSNRVIFILSFIMALLLWFWVSTVKSPTESLVISNVPVTISIDENANTLGLQVFDDTQYKVDVTVTGKRFAIQKLTASDITVIASGDSISSSGLKTLQLTATPKVDNSNYQISSLSKNSITVFFDTVTQKTIPVKIDVKNAENFLSAGYHIGNPYSSINDVIVSGPSSEIEKVTCLLATVNITENITSSNVYTPELKIIDEDENILTHLACEKTEIDIKVSIPLLIEKTLPVALTIDNLPPELTVSSFNISYSTTNLNVVIPFEDANMISSVSVGHVDYSALTLGMNSFTFMSDDFEYGVTDNNIKNVKVKINI